MVAPDVGDVSLQLLDSAFGFDPVTAELLFARHASLERSQPQKMGFQAVHGRYERAVRERRVLHDAHVDADDGFCLWQRLLNFKRCLDAEEPTTGLLRDRHVPQLAVDCPAVAISQPSELRKEDAGVCLVEFDLFRVWVSEAVRYPLLLEPRERCASLEEVSVCALQVFERLLLRVHWTIAQPRGGLAVSPLRELLAKPCVTELLFPGEPTLLVQSERLVEHETTTTGEATHIALLFPGNFELVFEGL